MSTISMLPLRRLSPWITLFKTRDVHFRQKIQSVMAQKPILTLQVFGQLATTSIEMILR